MDDEDDQWRSIYTIRDDTSWTASKGQSKLTSLQGTPSPGQMLQSVCVRLAGSKRVPPWNEVNRWRGTGSARTPRRTRQGAQCGLQGLWPRHYGPWPWAHLGLRALDSLRGWRPEHPLIEELGCKPSPKLSGFSSVDINQLSECLYCIYQTLSNLVKYVYGFIFDANNLIFK